MLLDRFKLTDKVAIVTGAGRGIGRAIAEAYAEVGADVVCAARTREQIDETAAAVRKHGRRALAVACDVTERAQLKHVVAETLREFGRLDVVVNNAGGWPPKGWQKTNEKFLEGAFRFNVTQAFLLSRMAIPHMRATGGGAIVNVSSAISRLIDPGFIAYGTSKAALNYMTKSLAAEVAPDVRVNAIAVGAVDTSALRPFLHRSRSLGDFGIDPALASAHLLHAVEEKRRVRRLRDDPFGSKAVRGEELRIVHSGGEEDHCRRAATLAQLAKHVEARTVRHVDVEQEQVGFLALNLR